MTSPIPPATSNPETPAPDKSTSSRRRCQGNNRFGEPCGAVAVAESGWCLCHDPDPARREKQREAWKAGGKHNARKWKVAAALSEHPTLFTVIETLSSTVEGVRVGAITPAIGNSVASLSRSLVAAIMAASDTSKVKELERLLDELQVTDRPRARLKAVP